jgi:hypothetical protein
VYLELVRLAREAVDAGKQKIGIGMLWEVLRWHFWLNTKSSDDFELNNNHRSHYARLIMQREPDLLDIFDTRQMRSP